jgi:hypothetical protein
MAKNAVTTKSLGLRTMRKIWKIFSRLPSKSENPEDYAAGCYQSGVIAVGWNGVGHLNQFVTRGALKNKLAETERKWIQGKPGRLGSWAGSLWNFKTAVKKGHFVMCPDKNNDRVYIGRVLSKHDFYDETPSKDGCDFAHRRKVEWHRRPLSGSEVRSIWKRGRFGGQQTVSEVRTGLGRLSRFLRRPIAQTVGKIRKIPWHPDKEWGRLAELRAITWLEENGKKPKDVADLRCGWDIECGEDKYEVKGRKSRQTTIRLTENEWTAAKKFGKRYAVLLFTAPTKMKLKKAKPWKIPDPVNTEEWTRRITVTHEYFLDER